MFLLVIISEICWWVMSDEWNLLASSGFYGVWRFSGR